MNDIELMKFAAKAVGGEFSPGTSKRRIGETWDTWEWTGPVGMTAPCFVGTQYPLLDDGAALRLASELRLIVSPGKHKGDGCTVESQLHGVAGCTVFRDDPFEQMRYAIVRVSAEIGVSIK